MIFKGKADLFEDGYQQDSGGPVSDFVDEHLKGLDRVSVWHYSSGFEGPPAPRVGSDRLLAIL